MGKVVTERVVWNGDPYLLAGFRYRIRTRLFESSLAVALEGKLVPCQKVLCETQGTCGVRWIIEPATSKIARATAFASNLFQNLFQKNIHVSCRGGMLRKENVSGARSSQECDRFFSFCNFCSKVTQKFRFDVFDSLLNNAKSIRVRCGFAHGLAGLYLREALQQNARPLKIGVALRKGALRGCDQFFRSTTQFFRRHSNT